MNPMSQNRFMVLKSGKVCLYIQIKRSGHRESRIGNERKVDEDFNIQVLF